MKSAFTITSMVLTSLLITYSASGQADGDYRSAASTAWNLPATWERFDGVMWQPNPTPPASADAVITIRSPHNVTVSSSVSADQITVDVGGTLTVSNELTLDDGTGDDLVVNGTLATGGTIGGNGSIVVNGDFVMQGTIQGNGALTVNGNTTWNSGTLDRTFTNQATRVMDIATSNSKTLNAPLTNAGTLNWTGGTIIQHVSVGGSFTNNATMTISSNDLYQDNNGNGFFTNNGTITKTSAGLTTFSNLIFSNPGIMNFNAGAVTFANAGSITNTGTISLTMATLNNNHTFNHNTGSVIQGSGSFTNGGTLNLNIDLTFPASIPFSSTGTIQGVANLTVNNDFILAGVIQGDGSLTVNGNTTWNSGTLDRTFTNQATRVMDIATANSKTLNAPLTNAGTLNWIAGTIIQHVSVGGSFTNNATMTISSNDLYQDNNGNGFFTNNGTMTKTSSGLTTFSNLIFSNTGTMNFNAGSVTFANGGSITNTGTINLTMVTLTNNHTFNHNTGAVIQGSGSFVNGGTLNLNVDLTFPASIPFSTSGTVQGDGNLTVNNDLILSGTIQGNGSLTVNGNTTWNGGTLDRTFTNQATRVMDIATANSKTLNAPLTNAGTLNWIAGTIVQHVSVGGSFTNNATMTISSNDLYQDNNGNGFFTNNGTMTKTSSGLTTFSNLIFSNTGTMNFNAGSVTFANGGSITNTGTINLTMVTLTNNHTFNHNTGAVIQGSGSFVNGGTLNLNIDLTFPASIPFSTSGTVQGDGNLTVNNDLILSGTIQGNGSLTVNGNTTWNGGTLDRTFTNQATRVMDIATANSKTLNAPLTNAGTLNWIAGTIVQHVSVGGSFTNNATMTISSNDLYQDNNGNGFFTNNGTMTKTSSGLTTFSNLIFSNTGTMNFNAGSVTFANGGSITNTGTINLTMVTLTNNHTFNHNTGAVIQGSGSFVNGGTLNLNVDLTFPASIPFSTSGTVQGDGNLTVNNDLILSGTIQGNGSLTVNGNTTWNGGTLDRTFTNQATRVMDIATANSKTLNAPLTNAGTLNWIAGTIVQHVSVGGSFTNNATMTISSNDLYQDNNGNGSFINNGTITKTSAGTTTFSNLIFSNTGTMNFNAGSVTFANGGSITNTGTINLTMVTLTNNHTFNHNAGSVIQGSGSFVNGGTLNLNVDLTFPASIPFSTTGTVQGDGNLTVNNNLILAGTMQGNGSLTVNGNTTWNSGTLDRTFTNQTTRIMDIATGNGKILNAPLTNAGTLNWVDGQIVQHQTVGGSWTNNGTMTISSNALYQDNNGNGPFNNTGTITKTSTGTTSISNIIFTNSGTVKGVGTIAFTNGGSVNNTGSIAPGLSPGILAMNDKQFLSANSTLSIEVASDSGPGTGHDQLQSNVNPLTLNGTLSVALINGFVPAAGNQYSVLIYPSATGTFSTEPPCWIVTYNATNTSITFNPAEFNICADNIVANSAAGLCSQIVNYTVEALGSPEPTLTYTFGGATTGSGDGTGSGSSFNAGVTNVTILADNGCSGASCAFTVTVMDTEVPALDCPDDITIGNTTGQCGATVMYSASATDNCEVLSVTFDPPSGSFFAIGTSEVDVVVTDIHGNSSTCTFDVTVNDTQAPSIDCPDNVTISNDAGTCGAVFNYTVLFDDNCPGEILGQTQGIVSGATFPVGTTTNVFFAQDAVGNTSGCSFTVTVVDSELPTIDCPDDVTVQAGQQVFYTVDFDDNCPDSELMQSTGLPSGSVFPVGITVNTFVVTDDSGNTSSCTFTVTVVSDTECEPPVGTACDDGDDCTINDVIGLDCNCAGTFEDTDGDGTCDTEDGCPDDPDKIEPGICGCGVADIDTDGDGTEDCLDGCPDDPNKTDPGICGCGVADDDTDGDGTEDCLDGCPDDPNKTDQGICGCGVADIDTDGDGTEDCLDGCPDDPDKTEPGVCGCGVADDDTDGDGTEDCLDECPNNPDLTAPATWYVDSDDDGYGSASSSELSCEQPDGFVDNDEDCDDTDGGVNPDATEVCNEIDDDCDGLTDEGVLTTWYADGDSDGYGNPDVSQQTCGQPGGFVLNDNDCNDQNDQIHPGATELCNGINDDCDAFTDEGCPGSEGTTISVDALTTVLESAGFVNVKVRLSEPSEEIITVSFKTINGSAKSGVDYRSVTTIVRFNPGQIVRSVKVPIIIDGISEPDEYFTVKLFNPQNAPIFNATGIVVITESLDTYQSAPFTQPFDIGEEQLIDADSWDAEGTYDTPLIVPNPQSKYATLQLIGPAQYRYDVVVSDMQGRVVADLKGYVNDWSMSGLNPGMYIYQVRYMDQHDSVRQESGKLVITD